MGLTQHFPVFIIAVPILGAVMLSILAAWRKGLAMPITATAIASSLAMSVSLIPGVLAKGYLSYYTGSWRPPLGIEIKIDFLGLFMMILVAAVSLMAVIYSERYIPREIDTDKIPHYYTLFLLLTGSMLGFSATGDIFNMFVFIEIMAITSYALVAVVESGRAIRASFKYLLMGVPSSILMLFAIAFLYAVTGTLNMGDLTQKIAATSYPRIAIIAYGIFVISFAVKSALFPLHIWLPDAHSIAPSPISALLSGLVVKMGILGIIRFTYNIYTVHYSPEINGISTMLSFIGAFAIIFCSIMAIRQKELKRMIAYSTVAHIGYIYIGVGLMNKAALVGSIFHILDHSLAKACLFMVAGSIIYASGYRNINDLKGAARKMPFSCAAFALAAASVVSIPPSAGFFSKWYLITGSLSSGNIILTVALLTGSVLAAFYCFRVVSYMFFLPPERGHWDKVADDVPVSMLVPVWILALSTLLFGVFSFPILRLLEKAVETLF
ncbi:MAG: monovalent cation/H+ antiporter subunit D family protein [Chloroflexota bacterium]